MSKEGCRPYMEVNNNQNEDIIFTNKNHQLKYYSLQEKGMSFEFKQDWEPILAGDVHFLFKHKGNMNDSLFCRIAFNTSFIPSDNKIVFNKQTVSPDKIKKDSRIDDDF